VSWHFGIDREGHCAYNVPITQKAWTISGLNSQTVNLEIVGTGHEPDYAGPGIKKVAAVVGRIGRIEHIPLSLGATDGHCNVTRRGIITHWMGGPCSGGHIDIKPYDIVEGDREIVARCST
jgi:N-acetyl-anhydromuramyl-L-alanine amidase AmpD